MIIVPAPSESEKKQKPMALKSAVALKSSQRGVKRNSTPFQPPGSVTPRTMRMSIRMKSEGMRIFESFSMPASTPRSTTKAVMKRKTRRYA